MSLEEKYVRDFIIQPQKNFQILVIDLGHVLRDFRQC